MNSTFSCINIEYKGVDGRISKIVFKDTTQEVKSWVRVKKKLGGKAMENASKALIMAAGVLIGVLILSLAAFYF